MPSAKSGTAGNLVPPAAPVAANDADDANPGAVEAVKASQRETGTGKYGSTPVTPFKKGQDPDATSTRTTTAWIEIVLVDEENDPVPGEPYAITLPDSTVASGTLDENGFARVDGFAPGTCKITFPQLDQDAWEPK